MATATYEIAESDELEALGRDSGRPDTSAALGPNDTIENDDFDGFQQSSGKRRWCLCFVIAILTLTATAAILGIFFSARTSDESTDNTQSASPTSSNGKGVGNSEPDQSQASPNDNTADLQPVSPPKPSPSPTGESQQTQPSVAAEPKTYTVNVLESLPHDPKAFTQGFEFADGFFYESTGLRGESTLRKVEKDTGKVLQKYLLPGMTLFGEGMTLHNTHHIFMLTWQAGRGFVFNQTTFEVIKEWKYEGEGWGLTMDRANDEVYMSDGTAQLRVLDPDDLSERRRVNVTLSGRDVSELNELEWVCGEIWANVWMTSDIYRIDPKTGNVNSVIDASNLPLKKDQHSDQDVLNGIAFDKRTGKLWLTGKKWKTVYQVEIPDDPQDLSKCEQ